MHHSTNVHPISQSPTLKCLQAPSPLWIIDVLADSQLYKFNEVCISQSEYIYI